MKSMALEQSVYECRTIFKHCQDWARSDEENETGQTQNDGIKDKISSMHC